MNFLIDKRFVKCLRLSAIGVLIFLLAITSLLYLPDGISIVAMLIGGMLVWGGFIWTIFTAYSPPQQGNSH